MKREFLVERFAQLAQVQLFKSKAYEQYLPKANSFPHFSIEIEPSVYRQIQVLVNETKKLSTMSNVNKKWFPVIFTEGEVRYKANMRMKGDHENHWKNTKKSWRVKFKREQLFHGYREIDFILPADKAYEVEKVACDMARAAGLLVPDTSFAKLAINGVEMGLYLMKENVTKEMLERLEYPEGEVIRPQNMWTQSWSTYFGLHSSLNIYFSKYNKPLLDLYPAAFKATVKKEPMMGITFSRWNNLLKLVREADDKEFYQKIEYYLDIDKYLRWNAITWLFGSTHAHWGDNLKWYYDNTVGLFEPILYDVYRYHIDNEKKGTFEASESDPLAKRLLRFSKYQVRRNKILWQMLHDPNYNAAHRSKALFSLIKSSLLQGVDAAIPSQLEEFAQNTSDILTSNRQSLIDHLSFNRMFISPSVNLLGEVELSIIVDSLSPLKIPEITFTGTGAISSLVRLTTPLGEQKKFNARVVVKENKAGVHFSDLELWTPRDENLLPVIGKWTLWFSPENPLNIPTEVHLKAYNVISKKKLPQHYLIQSPIAVKKKEIINQVLLSWIGESGLPLKVVGTQLTLAAGTYKLKKDLIFPKGWGFKLAPGVHLKMAPGVSIIAYGALIAKGTSQNPIRVSALVSREPWGSIGIINASQTSLLQHVHLEGGSQVYTQGLFVSGQLSFYRSDVELTDCHIMGAMADDGLNIKKAKFSINRCQFKRNSSDAFDGDWVEGQITNSVFSQNGGDGVDLSGSKVVLENNIFEQTVDKAISAGEKTRLVVLNNMISGAMTGLAIKDRSNVSVFASVFDGNKVAVSLFRKKQVFGGGRGEVVSSLFLNNKRDFELDAESSLNLFGVGLEKWNAQKGITTKDLRVGPVKMYYKRHGKSILSLKLRSSPFKYGPKFDRKAIFGIRLPDFSKKPIGLIRALAQPPLG